MFNPQMMQQFNQQNRYSSPASIDWAQAQPFINAGKAPPSSNAYAGFFNQFQRSAPVAIQQSRWAPPGFGAGFRPAIGQPMQQSMQQFSKQRPPSPMGYNTSGGMGGPFKSSGMGKVQGIGQQIGRRF